MPRCLVQRPIAVCLNIWCQMSRLVAKAVFACIFGLKGILDWGGDCDTRGCVCVQRRKSGTRVGRDVVCFLFCESPVFENE